MILSCQNLTKSFNEKCILRNVSFHIEDYEKAAIVGINGAGKTTLLRIIMGEQAADDGNRQQHHIRRAALRKAGRYYHGAADPRKRAFHENRSGSGT